MLRRTLFQMLGALGLTGTARAQPKIGAPRSETLLHESFVAGLRFHEGLQLVPQMERGQALTLVREPQNGFDARAVRIEWNGRMLGYVPAKDNATVASLLDRGEPVAARIVQLAPEAQPWEQVRVGLFLKTG